MQLTCLQWYEGELHPFRWRHAAVTVFIQKPALVRGTGMDAKLAKGGLTDLLGNSAPV